jgi:hypothetical protein
MTLKTAKRRRSITGKSQPSQYGPTVNAAWQPGRDLIELRAYEIRVNGLKTVT